MSSKEKKIRIYVEGGGDQRILKRECRRAFSKFFKKAKLKGRIPEIHSSGSRQSAFDDFRTAVNNPSDDILPLLLVDSEQAVNVAHQREGQFRPWDHLHIRDKSWKKPKDTNDNQVHFMVQCMEAWLIADQDSIEQFYGNNFNTKALPKNRNIELIEKAVLFDALKRATKDTQKGKYGKGAHSFKILEQVNPDQVFSKSKWAKRLKDQLDEVL